MMKSTLKSIFCLSLISLSPLFAATPNRDAIPVQQVFTPEGFNIYENAQIVISGFLPNLCHKSPKIDATVDESKKEINVSATSLIYDPSNPLCPEVILPFTKTVDIGELKTGEYKVFVNKNTEFEVEDKLLVDRTDPVDINRDKIFANVYAIEESTSNENEVILKGYNPSTCYELDSVTVNSDQDGTFTVTPILKQVSEHCTFKMTPLDIPVVLPLSNTFENILVHVKTMDGNSINQVINPVVLKN
ncbi:MAG: hypothetical protein VXV96_15330 [Bdellovibrionota bacterium]|nr:hypothetical protein [Bdellovibrionota bacterium]